MEPTRQKIAAEQIEEAMKARGLSRKQFADLMHRKVIHGIARSPEDALKIVKQGLIGYGYSDTDKKIWY